MKTLQDNVSHRKNNAAQFAALFLFQNEAYFEKTLDKMNFFRHNIDTHITNEVCDMDKYDKETGLPLNKDYLECNLLPFLKESIEQLERAWQQKENGNDDAFSRCCDYCELQSNINVAEVEQIITPEQAWYLREKYLGIKKDNDDI